MSTTTQIRWVDLIRPGDAEYTVDAPSVETRLQTFQWLTARADKHGAIAKVGTGRHVPGDGYSYPALTAAYFDEMRTIFARLLLARRPAPWLVRERVTLAGSRRLPFRSYVGGDDEVRGLIGAAFRLVGQSTTCQWNLYHSKARIIDQVFLRATPGRWAWHLQYGYEGSSWMRWFESNRGESLREFLRRWTWERMLAAPARGTT